MFTYCSYYCINAIFFIPPSPPTIKKPLFSNEGCFVFLEEIEERNRLLYRYSSMYVFHF